MSLSVPDTGSFGLAAHATTVTASTSLGDALLRESVGTVAVSAVFVVVVVPPAVDPVTEDTEVGVSPPTLATGSVEHTEGRNGRKRGGEGDGEGEEAKGRAGNFLFLFF